LTAPGRRFSHGLGGWRLTGYVALIDGIEDIENQEAMLHGCGAAS